ncbi:hypothetical protein GLYMA_10G055750v4 [Glycine max]|nr:hypothetical protein GLYMA_10G055750v4 [Glycine max]KAH1136939.1 hypothetical protein GYH30_027070 [Glycine max]
MVLWSLLLTVRVLQEYYKANSRIGFGWEESAMCTYISIMGSLISQKGGISRY